TPAGALARGEVRSVARCAGLPPSATGEVGLLAALAVAVGLLRVRGSRLEVTRLPALWSALAEQPRAGLVYAAWCHRLPWRHLLGAGPGVRRLRSDRMRTLRLLYGLPAGGDVDVPALVEAVGERIGLRGELAIRLVAAAFLDPLVALGVAALDPAPPAVPRRLRLGAHAATVVGSALLAGGDELPLLEAGGD
ncbi:MAG TPA: hypothetical protein VKG45_03280, partial [Actinomycetes bacterium]|nr:hypothetical protein [Actinomycetes bacterium]